MSVQPFSGDSENSLARTAQTVTSPSSPNEANDAPTAEPLVTIDMARVGCGCDGVAGDWCPLGEGMAVLPLVLVLLVVAFGDNAGERKK